MPRGFVAFVLAASVLWHVLSVVGNGWLDARTDNTGKDFASYYYAAKVATDGGDPYDKRELGMAARDERTRSMVHPFFYPPPFLLLVTWAAPLELGTAYRIWFWLDELWLGVAVLALWRWWRPLGDAVPVVLAATVALLTSVYDNHHMGQANLPVLALVVAGLWLESTSRERPWAAIAGGVLVGTACMLKMSPALFVAWWLLRRRWVAAAAACAMPIVLTVATLPILSLAHQLRFYTDVLPGFGSGEYNGLTVPIDMFGNHSIPNLFAQAFPATGRGLSTVAEALSTAFMVAIVAATAWSFRRPPVDALASAAQVACVAVVMLLVPVYTYEHHVVFAIPAVVVCVLALLRGKLGVGFGVALGLAAAAWAFDLAVLKEISRTFPQPVAGLAQEVKSMALVVLYLATLRLGSEAVGRASVPARSSEV